MATEEQVVDALRNVIDPELGLDIVNLGLIYGVEVDGDQVHVTMTLTTPGCPLHDSMVKGAEMAVKRIPGVESASVELVWEPAWTPERMSAEARQRLGWK